MTSCTCCVNTTLNPTILLDNGLCQICRKFKNSYQPNKLENERIFLMNRRAIIGVSGGKDSTASAYTAQQMGMELTAFTFDSGYYPKHIVPLAKQQMANLNIPHEVIDIRPYISPTLRESFRLTADLFDKPLNKQDALTLYEQNRQHYSVKDTTVMPFLRGCQLCRKMVIPAYYGEALKRNVKFVILGMNEWTHLEGTASGIRRIQLPGQKAVYIAHLPFIMRWSLQDTQRVLSKLNWQPPRNEDLVETNGNSCCLARATQKPFQDALGFHPDTTRLAREVTCGFLTREMAAAKLVQAREYDRTVRQVLKDADII